MEPTSIQVLKQEAEDVGLQGKDVEYVTRQQTLDREERAAWRDTQKRQVEFQMAELQAKTAEELQSEREKKADEIHTTERADEIKIQIAQIEAAKEQAKIEAAKEQAKIAADKELALKELELKAQQYQASTSLAATPPPHNKDAKSPKATILYRREG